MAKTTIFDLSVPIEEGPSELTPPKIVHQSHVSTADETGECLGCKASDLQGQMGWGNDKVSMFAHCGTHVDAPWHFYPTSEGKKARTIDEMPVNWFFGDAVVLDMRLKPNGYGITAADVQKALKNIGYKIKTGDIVLIQTGADKKWGTKDYYDAGCGMTRESTLWLIEQGVRVMGIDAWGFDRPFYAIKEEFARTGDRNILWQAHRVGVDKEYCHIEKLANLDKLPRPFGFKIAAFPVKLAGGSGGWCRAVAIFQE